MLLLLYWIFPCSIDQFLHFSRPLLFISSFYPCVYLIHITSYSFVVIPGCYKPTPRRETFSVNMRVQWSPSTTVILVNSIFNGEESQSRLGIIGRWSIKPRGDSWLISSGSDEENWHNYIGRIIIQTCILTYLIGRTYWLNCYLLYLFEIFKTNGKIYNLGQKKTYRHTEKLGIFNINDKLTQYKINWRQHIQRIAENRPPQNI